MNELDLFTEALNRTDPAERAAFLDQACAGNPDLRRRLEELLAGHARSGSPTRPAAVAPAGPGRPPTCRLDRDRRAPARSGDGDVRPPRSRCHHGRGSGAPAPRAATVPTGEGIGTVIAGRYTLVEVIGEGGMGSVYLASQTEPVKRQVALKLIKTGMDSQGVLARFDAERQALALMDHPNIARIYDGGLTPAGQPFFVMELVQGVPLTEYCDEQRLTVKARLELFVSVCQAVQHAHQKGIIHRDLKPGNVLVDGGGWPSDAEGDRLRRGQGDRAEADRHELRRHRGDRGHADVHVAGAGRPVVDGHRHAHRRLRPRGDALRAARPARRRSTPGSSSAGRCWRCCGWCARSIRRGRAPS